MDFFRHVTQYDLIQEGEYSTKSSAALRLLASFLSGSIEKVGELGREKKTKNSGETDE